MQLWSDIMYWLIAHQKSRIVSAFCNGISLNYPVFLYCFLKWKGDKILWANKGACFTLSFDCDYEKDVKALPQILDMLEQYRIPASFACIGKWIEKFPEIHRSLLDRGHEITNHTYSHPDNEQLDPDRRFNELSRREKREQIEKCHKVCKELLNYEPAGFRTPHFGRLFSEKDYHILKELNYSGYHPWRSSGGGNLLYHPAGDPWSYPGRGRILHRFTSRHESKTLALFSGKQKS